MWPESVGHWSLDSGAFTEISTYGFWKTSAAQYVEQIRRAQSEIGHLDWVAPQDWMCEPFILAKTGLDIPEHQRRTVENFLELRGAVGDLVIPVLQGWGPWDYVRHVEMYRAYGVDLRIEKTVGVGSICRRQHTTQASQIFALLHSEGISIHAFGLKLLGLKVNHDKIKSSDSMAWSFDARRSRRQLPGHPHINCANCLEFAELWRDKVKPYVMECNMMQQFVTTCNGVKPLTGLRRLRAESWRKEAEPSRNGTEEVQVRQSRPGG